MTAVVNYNSSCSIEDLRKGYVNHHNLTESSDGIIFFGNGDGGGGPNATMLERLRRARVVGEQNDASGSELPLVKCGRSLDDFFMTLREDTNNGEILPEWVGELYLEIHRGVSCVYMWIPTMLIEDRHIPRKRNPSLGTVKARFCYVKWSFSTLLLRSIPITSIPKK